MEINNNNWHPKLRVGFTFTCILSGTHIVLLQAHLHIIRCLRVLQLHKHLQKKLSSFPRHPILLSCARSRSGCREQRTRVSWCRLRCVKRPAVDPMISRSRLRTLLRSPSSVSRRRRSLPVSHAARRRRRTMPQGVTVQRTSQR